MIFQKGQKLVCIGDSTTDSGRSRPVGEGFNEALGKGYVANLDALITTVYPEMNLRIVNMGTSGNTVKDLEARWKADVEELKPDWVSIMIGINDVWRQHDNARQSETHVLLPEYRETITRLVKRTKPKVKGIILMTPYFIEPNQNDAMRKMLDTYGSAIKDLASQESLILVDTQLAIDSLLKHYYSAMFAWDRVHPNHVANMAVTRAFLNAVGFKW